VVFELPNENNATFKADDVAEALVNGQAKHLQDFSINKL
jgi:hypothetical protein